MTSLEIHPREDDRLAKLYSCRVLDTPRETAFDRVVFATSQLLRTPAVALSFVDRDRVWTKARVGFASDSSPRDRSFSAFVILQPRILHVEDATQDERFSRVPHVVGPPHIRSYVGVPVCGGDGLPLGALGAADVHPRALNDRELLALIELGRELDHLMSEHYPATGSSS